MPFKHLISADQLTIEDQANLFLLADKCSDLAASKYSCNLLDGAILGSIFCEASTRTRLSFETAFTKLGGAVISTSGVENLSLAKGESIEDMAKVVSGYFDAIVLRHPSPESFLSFVQHSTIPILNAGSGPAEHPTQALLDLYTIQQQLPSLYKDGSFSDIRICFIGDMLYGRTIKSLVKLLAQHKNISIHFVCVGDLEPPKEICDLLEAKNIDYKITTELKTGLQDRNVIYTTRVQRERFAQNAPTDSYQLPILTPELLASCNAEEAILMHPLPRDASSADPYYHFNDNPQLKIFKQAHNGLLIRMALFIQLFGLAEQFDNSLKPTKWNKKPNI